MDCDEVSNESFESVSRNTSKEKNNIPPDGLVSPTSGTKTTIVDSVSLGDSNDRIVNGSLFQSINKSLDDTGNNPCKNDEIQDNDLENNAKVDEDHPINGKGSRVSSNGTKVDIFADETTDKRIYKGSNGERLSQIGSREIACKGVEINAVKSNSIHGEIIGKSVSKDNSDEFYEFDTPEKKNKHRRYEESETFPLEMETVVENVATVEIIDENSMRQIATANNDIDKSFLHVDSSSFFDDDVENSTEKEHDDKNVSAESSYVNQSPADSPTSIVDEADESFSLDEVLVEESDCSEKDQIRNFSTDDHVAFDDNSETSCQADYLENSNQSRTDQPSLICGKLPGSLSINSKVSHPSSTCQEIVENEIILGEEIREDSTDTGVPVTPSSIGNYTSGEAVEKVHQNDCKSPCKENSSEVSVQALDTIDSSEVQHCNATTSPKKSLIPNSSSSNHPSHSPKATKEETEERVTVHAFLENLIDDVHSSKENSTEVPKDEVSSSPRKSVPTSEESTETLPVVPDNQNEKEAFREADETEKQSTNPEENSPVDESVTDTAAELLRNLRRRVSPRVRNDSVTSEPASNDAASPSADTEVRIRRRDQRPPTQTAFSSSHSSSNWQPQINFVRGASENISICLNRVDQSAIIKEEVIDESYGMDYATKKKNDHDLQRPWKCDTCNSSYTKRSNLARHQRLKHKIKFNCVDFRIKLDKVDANKDAEIASPRRNAAATTAGNRLRAAPSNSKTRRKKGFGWTKYYQRARNAARPSTTATTTTRKASDGENRGRRADGHASTRSSRTARRADSAAAKKRPTAGVRRGKAAGGENRRGLRSADADSVVPDDRTDFMRLLNLRSRRSNEDAVRGILVKEGVKTTAKRVSFRLPEESAASSGEGRTDARPRSTNVARRSATRRSSRDGRVNNGRRPTRRAEKRSISTTSKESASSPKRSRSSTSTPAPEETTPDGAESEEEVVFDEQAFEKLDLIADVYRKSVDEWYECTCCSQRYVELENVKRHVRTHFPNCLTN